ncbi:MAG: HYR domain-containing protein, partial [Bacteroidetes bacterium]|nr:HYR domain-containing protein [Bacteroidota bacterium]
MSPTKAIYPLLLVFLVSLVTIESNGQSSNALDSLPPTISNCPVNSIEVADSVCEFIIQDYTGIPLVEDDSTATPDLIITQWPLAGTILSGHGTSQTVTLTVTDANGNSADCSFEINLEDHMDPVIACPEDVTVSADSAACEATDVILGLPL